MSKLKALHVAIIGFVVCILIVVGTFFLVIKKANEEITALNGRLDAATAVENTRQKEMKRLADAKINNQKLQATLEKYMRAKMPAISFQDRPEGMIALWKEHAETLGPLLRAWPAKTGVNMTTGVTIPAPPVDPNTIDTSIIKIPVGSFTVTGDYATLMDHIRSWNRFNRLVQIDVGSLSGMGQFLTLNYTVTVYIFPRGEAGPTATMAGAATPGA
jgi:hypothetical protein